MPKRKGSFSVPYERPEKLTKRTSSTTVSRSLSVLRKTESSRAVLKPVKLLSAGSKKSSTAEVAKVSASAPVDDSPTQPSLRRASTFTLEDEDAAEVPTRTASPSKSLSKPASLSRKSSSFVEEGTLVTKLSGLKSGSIIGETSMAPPDFSKARSLSRKSSSVVSSGGTGVPSVPSGLTKLAMPTGEASKLSLRVSKSKLLTDVDETEMDSALASLKAAMSKGKSSLSKTSSSVSSSSMAKKLSKRTSTVASSSSKKSDTHDATTTEVDDVTGEGAMDTSEAATGSVDPGLPPGGLMEVAISFDTTGSMYGVLEEVRAKVKDLVQRLQGDIPGIRISVIAHGDYCDEGTSYVIKWIDFGATLPEVCNFVSNAGRTGGGDGPECYELVMQRAREVLSWTPGSQRALILIGDNLPHEPGYRYGGKQYFIDWREECEELRKMGVKIYSVQAGVFFQPTSNFYSEIARVTNGKHIYLKDFSSMFDFIMMICYREANPDMIPLYEQEMKDRSGRLADDVNAFLRSDDATALHPFGVPAAVPLFAPFAATPLKKPRKPKTPRSPKAKPAKPSTVKKTKPTNPAKKAAGKRKKAVKKKSKLYFHPREKLSDARLNQGPDLRKLTWTKWVKVIVPDMPTGKAKAKFSTCKGYSGFVLNEWFEGGMKEPAVYEFAVQCCGPSGKPSGKKYVMFCKTVLKGYQKRKSWCHALLKKPLIKKEIHSVLGDKCCIYVRRATVTGRTNWDKFNKMGRIFNVMRTSFDYAWVTYPWRRNSGSTRNHRRVAVIKQRKHILLSHDVFLPY